MVPLDHIAEYYVPEERLAEIVAAPLDSLEEEAAALTVELAQAAGIPVTALGVTGSLLPAIHNPVFSDIDLTVYGAEHAWRIRSFLRDLKLRAGPAGPESRIRPLTAEEVDIRRRGILTIHPTLAPADGQYLAQRRWNFLRFGERYFSVHATRTDDEIEEVYGDHVYRDGGIARVVARVVDVSGALFSPAVYRVDCVRVVEGQAADIREVVSFDRIFADAADPGDEIEVWGRVEHISGAHDRLVIGTAVLPDGGYLVPHRDPHADSLPERTKWV